MTQGAPPPSPPRRPTDLEVEQWRLGELAPDDARRVARALETLGDPRGASTDVENAALFERVAPLDFEREVLRRAELADRRDAARERADARRASSWAWTLGPAAALAALLLGLFIWSGGIGPWWTSPDGGGELNGAPKIAVRDPVDTEPGIRIKGQRHQLIVRVKDGSELHRLEPQQRVSEGDVLQLSYVAGSHRYGVIVSIDGRGVVTLHFPAEPASDTRLVQRKETPLGHSYELDDAPGFERFIFVVADAPIDPAQIVAAAEALAKQGPRRVEKTALILDEGLDQATVLVRKEN